MRWHTQSNQMCQYKSFKKWNKTKGGVGRTSLAKLLMY
jgi:hypothetical protein